tara:strand:- start:424 stop:681 length:258 start_codon:yes stop_codon:yes gene_type:complete
MEKKIVTLIEKRTQKQGYNFSGDNKNVVSFYPEYDYYYEVSTLRNTCEFHIGEIVKPAKVRTMCMNRDSYRVIIKGEAQNEHAEN